MSERNFIDDSIVFDEESLPKGMKEEIKDLEKYDKENDLFGTILVMAE